jgi:hypothetical protein
MQILLQVRARRIGADGYSNAVPAGSDSNRLLCGGWVDQSAHRRNSICWKTYALGVFLDGGLVLSEVHAVHFVAGYIAMQPLDLRPHTLQNLDGLLGEFPQLCVGQIARSRDFAFDYKFWHAQMLACTGSSFKTPCPRLARSTGLRPSGRIDMRLPWIFDRYRSR